MYAENNEKNEKYENFNQNTIAKFLHNHCVQVV